jgi:hypothetical protein
VGREQCSGFRGTGRTAEHSHAGTLAGRLLYHTNENFLRKPNVGGIGYHVKWMGWSIPLWPNPHLPPSGPHRLHPTAEPHTTLGLENCHQCWDKAAPKGLHPPLSLLSHRRSFLSCLSLSLASAASSNKKSVSLAPVGPISPAITVRAFRCRLQPCSELFTTRSNRTRHENSSTAQGGTRACGKCGKAVARRADG